VLGDILEGHDRSRFEEYLEAVDLEVTDLKAVDLEVIDLQAVNLKAVTLEAVNLEAVHREACTMEAGTLFIFSLRIVRNEYNNVHWVLKDWLEVGNSRS